MNVPLLRQLQAGDVEGLGASAFSERTAHLAARPRFQLVTSSTRVQHVLYRRPYGKEWEQIPPSQAIEMLAQRMKKARDENWQDKNGKGDTATPHHVGWRTGVERRSTTKKNYLIKKLFTAMGIVQIENQARI